MDCQKYLGVEELLASYWMQLQPDFPHHPALDKPHVSFPVLLHGDEGRACGREYMILSWQPELSEFKGDSLQSRFLITLIPSASYAFGDDKALLL